jgi:phage shock protein PspC (stress-responsive transcriptional regulator)
MQRDLKNAMLAGVCAGLANKFDVPVMVIRAAFVVLSLWFLLPAVLYLVLWACTPPVTVGFNLNKLYRDPQNGVIGGVCAGLCEGLGWDVLPIRLLWVVSVVFLGFGLLPYLILWIVLPKKTI